MQTLPLYLLQNRGYCRWKFYISGLGNFACCCDLDLDSHPLNVSPQIKMKYLRQSFRKLLYYVHTDRHTEPPKTLRRRFAGLGNVMNLHSALAAEAV